MNIKIVKDISENTIMILTSMSPIYLITAIILASYIGYKLVDKIFKTLNKIGLNLEYYDSDRILKKIDIREVKSKHLSYKHAVTLQEVKDYLSKLASRHPEAFKDIKVIELSDANFHDIKYIDRLLGDFDPKGSEDGKGKVCLYPFRYSKRNNEYSVNVSDNGNSKLIYTEQEAKEAQLFTLGHELRHNMIYQKGGSLGGKEIEENCDKFSEKLGLARKPSRIGKLRFLKNN